MKNRKWMLGFLGLLGIPGLIAHDWFNSLWFVFFFWFFYLIAEENNQNK